MRLRLKARRRLSRILIARDKEWQKYLQNLRSLPCHGDNEGCASDQEGYDANPESDCGHFCCMRLRLRARIRLHRITMKRIEREMEEWDAFMEQWRASLRQGDDEGCASNQEGYNADPKARRRSFSFKELSRVTSGSSK